MLYDLIGKQFKNGGRGPDDFDCWGLAREVFSRHGIELPDYQVSCKDASRIDSTITDQRQHWRRITVPVVPCLVVMRFNSPIYCNHTGVYVGEGRFIHIAERMGVHIDRVDSPAWHKRIEGFYVPEPEVLKT